MKYRLGDLSGADVISVNTLKRLTPDELPFGYLYLLNDYHTVNAFEADRMAEYLAESARAYYDDTDVFIVRYPSFILPGYVTLGIFLHSENLRDCQSPYVYRLSDYQ